MFEIVNDAIINGTGLVGKFIGTYYDLERFLGEPNGSVDDGKSTTCWEMLYNDRHAVTIYDYKTGMNVDDIRSYGEVHWHIGGRSKEHANELIDYLRDHNVIE